MKQIAGIILAGGSSTRMGVEKALMPLGGRPVIAHVIERLAPQTGALAISANGDAARFDAFHLAVIRDTIARQPGPLAGIAAGLAFAISQGAQFLVTTPCDAPFLPRDLVAQLIAARGDARVVMAQGAQGLEPLFALWSVTMLAEVAAGLRENRLAVHRLAQSSGAAVVDIRAERGAPDWSLNLNRPEDHELASALVQTSISPP